jgi:hypothetical protein
MFAQGSSSPAHYTVLHDDFFGSNRESGLRSLQLLTHALTFGYANWSSPIRVPVHCQYAQRIANQAGDCTRHNAHEQLTSAPVFL